jgi:murein DD-endopeptidase MepM/ murein hydrolase activator NlpD
VDRRYGPTLRLRVSRWERSARAAVAALSTTDGRWALVSTSLTALIAGTIAWLALATVPPSTRQIAQDSQDRTLLPYQLFQQLTRTGDASYAAFAPGRTIDARPRIQTGAPQGSLDNSLAEEEAGDNSNPTAGVETRSIALDSGDTLVGALTDAGATQNDAQAVVNALARIYDLRSLRAGQSFELTFQSVPQATMAPGAATISNLSLTGDGADDDNDADGAFVPEQATPAGKLLSISFSPTVEHDIAITRGTDGTFAANDVVKKLESHVHRAGATIDSSLYLAAMQAGIPADVVVEMIHMFSYKVDFQRDIHPGDSFEVFYNYYYTPDGQPAKEGQISYAVMRLDGREIALYRYQADPSEPPDYFDAHGQSAKGMLMKTPVDGARITSGFGMRFHPILGYTRMHKGVDFGVPIGTPVMAAGAGTIAFMGVQHGYGNFVLINHGNGYSTAYGHLSRFAPGMHQGARVRQGQVVAYSGMTGMATGPHLHYEIRVNNEQVNPQTVKIAQGRILQGRDKRDFLVERLHVDSEIAGMPLETKVADASSDLRQAKAK